jgi:hypothetical protein
LELSDGEVRLKYKKKLLLLFSTVLWISLLFFLVNCDKLSDDASKSHPTKIPT